MPWWRSWSRRRRAAAAIRTACPAAWAAWATWICKSVGLAVAKKGRFGVPFHLHVPAQPREGRVERVSYNSRLPAVRVVLPDGQVAQLVEQRTENPCVGGSIPPLATNIFVF